MDQQERIEHAVNAGGLLVVRTTAGRTICAPFDKLPVRLSPGRNPTEHQVDVDPNGLGVYVDMAPLTLTRLRREFEGTAS